MTPCPEIDGWFEPLDRWRYYARQFQAVLRIADRLNANQPGKKEDWAVLDPQEDPMFATGTTKTLLAKGLAGARNRLCGIVNDFPELGAVRPELFVEDSNWRIYYHSVGSGHLFGALAIQLVLAVASVDGFAICSACPNAYLPERWPNPNQNHYCSKQCRKKGQALASRKYRLHRASPIPDALTRDVLAELHERESESIGSQIEQLREECGWTNEHLAEILGISLRSVERHVSGDSMPYPRHILAYERKFSKHLNRMVVISKMS